MKSFTQLGMLCLFLLLSYSVSGQGFLKAIKDKVKNEAEKTVNDVIKGDSGSDDNTSSSSGENNSSSSGARNSKGGGLIVTAPDVKENLGDAESSFSSKRYNDAKYALKQAIIGVEMEIGESLLKSLPASVDGLGKNESEDKVTSTGIGFVGLTIERKYGNDDRELEVMIANNSAMMAGINMYLANSGYAASSSDQNWKQVKVKGYRGVLEYDDYSGYKLSVPIGQSSLIVWQGVNFESEPAMMAAAENFDLDGIKEVLGEK